MVNKQGDYLKKVLLVFGTRPEAIKIVDRRAGDIAKCFANPKFAKDVLDWEAKKNLDDMCQDSYNWQKMNPNGYEKS